MGYGKFFICLLSFTFILKGSGSRNFFVRSVMVNTTLKNRALGAKVLLLETDTRSDFLKKACLSWGISEKKAGDFELWARRRKVSFVDRFEEWKDAVISSREISAFMQKRQANPATDSVLHASYNHELKKIKFNAYDSPSIIKDRIRSSFGISDDKEIYYKKIFPIGGSVNLKIATVTHSSYF